MLENSNEKFNEFIESIKNDENFVLVGRGDDIAAICNKMLEEPYTTGLPAFLNPYSVYKLTRTWIGDKNPTYWYKVNVAPLN